MHMHMYVRTHTHTHTHAHTHTHTHTHTRTHSQMPALIQLSPEVTRVVYSFPAKLLKEKLVSLAKAHFNLATTVITGIPMKVRCALFTALTVAMVTGGTSGWQFSKL